MIFRQVRQSRGYFHLDLLGNMDSLTDAGNLTGLGRFGDLERDTLREIRMALSRNDPGIRAG